MRILALILSYLMLIPMPLLAATTYIDPTCTHNGDGTTTDCAASASATGAMNAWPASPNINGADAQFLQKAGTTSLKRVVVSSGTAGHPLILGAYGTGAKPIIRSEEGANQGTIQINTDAHDITIDGLEIHGQLNLADGTQSNAIRNNATDYPTLQANITVQNCIIGPVLSFNGSGNDGIDLRGHGLIVQDNTFLHIASDAVWLTSDGASTGDELIIRRNTCSHVSEGDTTGDCYQLSGTTPGGIIEENYCDHTTHDAKYCAVNSAPDVHIRYNEFHAFVGGSTNWPIFTTGTATMVYGNRTYNGAGGIGNYSEGGWTYGNVVTDPGTIGIAVNQPDGVAANNTIEGIAEGQAAIRLDATATNARAFNNILSDAGEGIRLTTASGHTESNNMFHGTITTPIYNTTTSSALAATNGVTASNQLTSDYKTIGASTARRAGRDWAGCMDLRGRPCWSPPDIGAYQSSSGDPAATRAVRN